MKPCLVARDRVSVDGEHRVKSLSLVFTREMGKSLLLLSLHVIERRCCPTSTDIQKTGSLYYTDDWFAFNSLLIRGDHVVMLKEKGIPKGRNHMNGIEGFWSFAKHWLCPYPGYQQNLFPSLLKRVEWRFNHRNENLVILLRRLLNQQISIVKEQI